MVSCFISRLVILIFGTLYPAYASYKAVRTKNVKEYVKWMMYWIVFALFTCAETFTDLFLSFWFPFYYELKIITVIYLLSPATKGSSILYRKFVHPALIKKEQDIDEYISKAKEQGYHTMLNLGSKGVTYATSLLMQTAIKGGGGLVNQLRRSYSLSDLSEEQALRQIKEEAADGTDSPYDEDPRLVRRKLVQSSRKTLPSPDQAGLYFPETEIYERPEDQMTYRQIPSYEQMSSGYSSGEPLYYNIQQPRGDHLVRTASLGPSSRIRTRSTTKLGLPKRAGLSEERSTWSALESDESQNETDRRFSIPLSHSASFPLPFPSLQHFVMPEYQYLFGNMPQNQIFTFINHSQYSQFLNNKKDDIEKKSDEIFNNDNASGCSNGVVLLEDNSDNCKDKTLKEMDTVKMDGSVKSDDKGDVVVGDEEKNVIPLKSTDESHSGSGVENKNSETMAQSCDSKDRGRSGKYKKKPAPTPPTEELSSNITQNLTGEDDEVEFFTPNASPKLSLKHSSSLSDLQTKKNTPNHELDVTKSNSNLPEVTKKSKSKTKKGDFNLQKKLHIPKMTFSFWHQKSGKETSPSDTSSVASVEIPATKSENKEELEYFIPLKGADDENEENNVKDEAKNL